MDTSIDRIFVPDGYVLADEFSGYGDNISIAAGAGFGSVAVQELISRTLQAGAKCVITYLSCRVLDAGSDQIYLALQHNGFEQYPWHKIPGSQFDFTPKLSVDKVFTPGIIRLVGKNKSGTSESGSGPASAIRVQAYWIGYLLAQKR